MAKAPLIFDNSILWGVIQVIDDPGLRTPWAEWANNKLLTRDEYQIWVEHEGLRESAKAALSADYLYFKLMQGKRWYHRFSAEMWRREAALLEERDKLVDDYEFMRRLIATDNMAIAISRS